MKTCLQESKNFFSSMSLLCITKAPQETRFPSPERDKPLLQLAQENIFCRKQFSSCDFSFKKVCQHYFPYIWKSSSGLEIAA